MPARARVSAVALPRAHGAPALAATMRNRTGDFVVEEIDAFAPSGEGEHLMLAVEKRGMNTAHVARRIAQWAGVPESAVGHAGEKDRHAVARPRRSVQRPGAEGTPLGTLASSVSAS